MAPPAPFKPRVTQFNHYDEQRRFEPGQWHKQTKFNDWSQPSKFNFQNYDDLSPTRMSDVNRLTGSTI